MYLHDKIWIRFVVYDCCGRAHFTRTNILARAGNVTIDAICRNKKVNKAKMDARKLLASYISLAILRRRNKKKKRKRAIWSRSWLKRSDRGVYRQLLEELRLEDPENYRRYLRMDTSTFEVFCKILCYTNIHIYSGYIVTVCS